MEKDLHVYNKYHLVGESYDLVVNLTIRNVLLWNDLSDPFEREQVNNYS